MHLPFFCFFVILVKSFNFEKNDIIHNFPVFVLMIYKIRCVFPAFSLKISKPFSIYRKYANIAFYLTYLTSRDAKTLRHASWGLRHF